jgi:hypothetical protein
MSTLAVILVAAALVVLVLLVLATLAVRKRSELGADAHREHLAQADRALEEARAADRGWDRSVLEDVARAALNERRPGWDYRTLDLVLVDDRPGVEEDRAQFRASDGDEHVHVLLSRRAEGWTVDEVR